MRERTSEVKKPAENSGVSAKSKRPRSPGRPFAPGQSGNPGGRPKVYADFREMCRDQSPEAVEALVDALKACDASSVAAARVLLEYAWGKPPSAPEDLEAMRENTNPLAGLTTEQLMALAKEDR